MKSGRTSVRALMAGALAVACVVTGCSSPKSPDKPAQSTADNHDIRLPADYSGEGPGTLRDAIKLPVVDRRIMRVAEMAARITYVSTSAVDGSLQNVTGTVFEPTGHAPEGGWPVIVFGHGSVGVGPDCAPSLSPTLNGGADSIRAMMSLGYVLVMPDYQGLGSKSSFHPYLDATTEGYNLIDAARAVHKLLPNISDKWVALGVSQGAQASWAANELNAKYSSPDINLVGSVSVSPATDISGLADLAMAGQLTPPQNVAMVLILTALKKRHPDLNLDDYRRGSAQKNWAILGGCAYDSPDKRLEIAKALSPDDLRPANQPAVDLLRTYLMQLSGLPRSPASAPMLVLHGDADQLLPVAWTEQAVKRACEMGDVVASFIAFRLDGKPLWWLPLLLVQRFTYRQLMYLVCVRALIAAVSGGHQILADARPVPHPHLLQPRGGEVDGGEQRAHHLGGQHQGGIPVAGHGLHRDGHVRAQEGRRRGHTEADLDGAALGIDGRGEVIQLGVEGRVRKGVGDAAGLLAEGQQAQVLLVHGGVDAGLAGLGQLQQHLAGRGHVAGLGLAGQHRGGGGGGEGGALRWQRRLCPIVGPTDISTVVFSDIFSSFESLCETAKND